MRARFDVRRGATVVCAAAIAYAIIRHFVAVHAMLYRPLDGDEVEYLHAGWLMHQGLRLYRDFCEDHAPFFLMILEALVPAKGTLAFPTLDLESYVARARLLSGILGGGAVLAVAAVAYRGTRNIVAPLVTIAALLSAEMVWRRGLTDARHDPPSLLFFWLGALLLLWDIQHERRRLLMAGFGIGLVAMAGFWNPKWPIESAVLGVVYLLIVARAAKRGVREVALAIAPAIACVGVALAIIKSEVTLADYYFFTFRYNVIAGDWISRHTTARTAVALPGENPMYRLCSAAFKGIWPIVAVGFAIMLAAIPALRRRAADVDMRITYVLLALAAAATIEIRFLYPFPNVYPQYYLMWSFIAACLYGVMDAAALALVPRAGMRAALQIAVAVTAAVIVERAMPLRPAVTGWPLRSYLQRQLRPGETVWVAGDAHPIGVRDASYYWFDLHQLVVCSIEYAAAHPGETPLPPVAPRNLPVCRAERGELPQLRFVADEQWMVIAEERECLQRMIASGRAVSTPTGALDLHPRGRAEMRTAGSPAGK